MTPIQKAIEETVQRIVHLEKVASQLDTTKEELESARNEETLLERKLNRELAEIERLDGLSTKGLFYKILGSKEEQLEKERQEYLELSLKFEDVKNSIQILEYEVNLLEGKLNSRDDLKKRLENLKQERENEIIQSDPSLRSQLLHISEELEAQYRFRQEIAEAVEKGTICNHLLAQIIKHLKKVRNWGQWGHKDRYHRHIKREAVDRARNLAFQVKHQLNLFESELQDLNKRAQIQLDVDTFENFTNFFFDNLITDWIMQQQVSRALSTVSSSRKQVASILIQLEKDNNEALNTISLLTSERERILLS